MSSLPNATKTQHPTTTSFVPFTLWQPECRKLPKIIPYYRKNSPAFQEQWSTTVSQDNSLNNPSCFISLPQPSNGLTNNWDICGALESTSLSLGAQQGSYAIQEVIMHSTSSFKNKTKPHSFYTAHKLKKKKSGKDCFGWKKEKCSRKAQSDKGKIILSVSV